MHRIHALDHPHRYHRYHRYRAGTEPGNARSDLALRAVLSAVFAPLFAGPAAGLAVAAGLSSGSARTAYVVLAVFFAILAVTAIVDLIVVTRRRRAGDY
jgi:hypothetical protein